MVAANTKTSNRLVDILLAAIAKVFLELVPAGSYGSACVHTLGGIHPATGRRFVHHETVGGGAGATARAVGASGFRVHMGNTMNLPIEAIEAVLPVRFASYELVPERVPSDAHATSCGSTNRLDLFEVQSELLGLQSTLGANNLAVLVYALCESLGAVERGARLANSSMPPTSSIEYSLITSRHSFIPCSPSGRGGWESVGADPITVRDGFLVITSSISWLL